MNFDKPNNNNLINKLKKTNRSPIIQIVYQPEQNYRRNKIQ